MLLIQNGTVLDPYTETCKKLDILIDDAGIIHRSHPPFCELYRRCL